MSDTLSHSHMHHFLKRNIATCSYAEALSYMFLRCKTESVFVMAHISQLNAGPLCSYYFCKFKYVSGKTLILSGDFESRSEKPFIRRVNYNHGSCSRLTDICSVSKCRKGDWQSTVTIGKSERWFGHWQRLPQT